MNLEITDFSDLGAAVGRRRVVSDGEFEEMVKNAAEKLADDVPVYFRSNWSDRSSGFVVVSPKFEEKMQNDPKLAEEIEQKVRAMYDSYGENRKNSVIVVDRNGEIAHYCTKSDKERPEHPTAEELKEAAKARARKKARLDAYFHLLERICIKRKLIEQENAKRALNKKYRYSVSKLNCLVNSLRTATPPKDPEYYF